MELGKHARRFEAVSGGCRVQILAGQAHRSGPGVDAKTGKQIWRYDLEEDRTMTQREKLRLCCGVNSRGLALYEDKLLVPVIDGRMPALDASTGRLLWSRGERPEGADSAPPP